jgi:septal ring factor EnvC (AmiA/AmiB activator)
MTQPGTESFGTPPVAETHVDLPGQTVLAPMPTPPAPARGRGATVVFAVLSVLLLLSTGAMAGLYFMKSKDADKLTTQLKSRDTTISQDADQIKDLKKQLSDSKQAQDAADKKLASYQACVTAIREAALAEVSGTPDPVKTKQANDACIGFFLGGN